MEKLPSELLSFIFDFVPEESLELRTVCDEWDFVITKYYNTNPIRNLITFKEIIDIFYRSKLNLDGYIFIYYIRYIHSLDLYGSMIEEVSFLRDIHTLDLYGCIMVKDVSNLGNIHTLNIRQTDVKDVSALGSVHTLKLGGNNIIDCSALGDVHNFIQ